MTAGPRFRTALVTGGSSGIGEELAVELGRRGVTRVAVAGRRKEELERVAARIRATGAEPKAIVLDVANTAGVVDAVRALEKEWDGLDLVVANAGVSLPVHPATGDWRKVEAVFQVNVMGAMATLFGAAPGMAARRRGHLVGISSVAAFRGMPQNGAYSASKAALMTLCESMRIDLRPFGVRVTSIHPGFIRTPMTVGNENPMPFLIDADVAARKIARAIERGKRRYVFPWPMALLIGLARNVPGFLFDLGISRVRVGKVGDPRGGGPG